MGHQIKLFWLTDEMSKCFPDDHVGNVRSRVLEYKEAKELFLKVRDLMAEYDLVEMDETELIDDNHLHITKTDVEWDPAKAPPTPDPAKGG